MDDWNGDVEFINQRLDFSFNFDVFSVEKLDWSLVEKNVTLFLDFCIGYSCILGLAIDEMFVDSGLINLLLLEPSNHFFLFHIEVSEVGHELNLFVIVHLEKSLSFLLFESSSLTKSFILYLSKSVVPFSLGPQVILSSLPQVLLFSLGNDIESSSFSLDNQLVLLHENVVVL